MTRKLIIAALAALTITVGMQAPATAAMTVAKPASIEAAVKTDIVQVHRRRGKWRRWHRHGHHHKHHWHHDHHYGSWAWYKKCLWKQRHGYRIYCPYPY